MTQERKRVWLCFIATGAISGSGNTSSIVDNGVGNFTINFITAMQDVNYSVCLGANRQDAASLGMQGYQDKTTGSVRIISGDNGGALSDNTEVSVTINR